ncbi:MAG TPA: hypothetical protein VD866_30355 [Urbifossiella sp.]|nr:hypothetical protein [Urbifossiella sp.]
MSKSSPSPATQTTIVQPRAFTGPIRACPRWDTTNGTLLEPGVTLSGLTFSTNREIPHEVVLVDSSGNPVTGVVITPSILTPSGGPPTFTGSVSVMVPTDTPGGDYYLQVRIPAPDTAANYTHTVELQVAVGPAPIPPVVVIVPAPGSEPGSYPVGTWIILDSAVTGGTPPYTFNWLLNGAPHMGSSANFSFQLNEGPISVSLQVTDAGMVPGTSPALDYTGVASAPFKVDNFRRDPDSTPIANGTGVAFHARFSGGTPPYSCEVHPDPSTILPTVTTSGTVEVPVGAHPYGTAGTFTAVLMARDFAGATESPTLSVEVS